MLQISLNIWFYFL